MDLVASILGLCSVYLKPTCYPLASTPLYNSDRTNFREHSTGIMGESLAQSLEPLASQFRALNLPEILTHWDIHFS